MTELTPSGQSWTCPNGHRAETGQKFCPECGAQSALPVDSLEDTTQGSRWQRIRSRDKVLAALATVVLLATLGWALTTQKDSGGSDVSTAAPLSPEERQALGALALQASCFDELSGGFQFAIDNDFSSAAVSEIGREWGTQSQQFEDFRSLLPEVLRASSSNGRQAGRDAADRAVADLCAQRAPLPRQTTSAAAPQSVVPPTPAAQEKPADAGRASLSKEQVAKAFYDAAVRGSRTALEYGSEGALESFRSAAGTKPEPRTFVRCYDGDVSAYCEFQDSGGATLLQLELFIEEGMGWSVDGAYLVVN